MAESRKRAWEDIWGKWLNQNMIHHSISCLLSLDHLDMKDCVRVESQLFHVLLLVLRVWSSWEIAHKSEFALNDLLHPTVNLRYLAVLFQLEDADFAMFSPNFECANLLTLGNPFLNSFMDFGFEYETSIDIFADVGWHGCLFFLLLLVIWLEHFANSIPYWNNFAIFYYFFGEFTQ